MCPSVLYYGPGIREDTWRGFLLPDHADVEMCRAQLFPQCNPKRHVGLARTRTGDVAEIGNVLPSKRSEQSMNCLLCISVVARQEDRVGPGCLRGIDHHLAIDGIEGLNDLRLGKRLLNLFAERFGSARLRRKDVSDVNKDFAGKVLFAGRSERFE